MGVRVTSVRFPMGIIAGFVVFAVWSARYPLETVFAIVTLPLLGDHLGHYLGPPIF
jgi:hypothetical protein